MAYKDNEKTVEYDAHLYSKNGNVIANKNLKSEEGKVDLKDKVTMQYNTSEECVEFIFN